VTSKAFKGKENVSEQVGTSHTPLIVEVDKDSAFAKQPETHVDDSDEKDLLLSW